MTHDQHDRLALTVALVSLALFVWAALSGCITVRVIHEEPQERCITITPYSDTLELRQVAPFVQWNTTNPNLLMPVER